MKNSSLFIEMVEVRLLEGDIFKSLFFINVPVEEAREMVRRRLHEEHTQ